MSQAVESFVVITKRHNKLLTHIRLIGYRLFVAEKNSTRVWKPENQGGYTATSIYWRFFYAYCL